MKIVFLLDEQFPYGMAAANRALLYAKGFVELGNNFVMFIPRATERQGSIRNTVSNGTHEGVRFRYAYETVIRRSFMGRRYQNIVSFINSLVFFLRFKPDVILLAAKTFKYIILVKVCSILTGAKLVREKSEVPFYKREELSWFNKLRIKTEFRLFDGIIVISKALGDFFTNELKLNIRTFEVPIIVDCGSSTPGNDSVTVLPNLVYTGSLLDHKDGVLTILKSFARIRNKHDVRLIMSGNVKDSIDKEAILTLIEDLNLKNEVELTGYITREELNYLTATATALLVAKPDNRQNRYNMATKVGEYLLSGRPAVISSVDPICKYLKHRENICIAEPVEEDIVGEVEFLLKNPSKANEIGITGRESVMRFFDYRIHAPRIISFFKTL